MASKNLLSIRVWGDFACFTRPEMKVERVSYPLMTPSAARGIVEAVFWEPEIFYLVDAVRIVKKGKWVSFRRNEVTSVVSLDSAQTWMNSPEKVSPIQAGGGAADGTQRNMLALEDVEYIITAEVRLSELGAKAGQRIEKYTAEIERRARQGKCFHRPALGVREFAADFEWCENPDVVKLADWPEEDLGLMLYDVFDPESRKTGFKWANPESVSGPRYDGSLVAPKAIFFHAFVKNAAMTCHPERVKLISATRGGITCS